MGRCDDSESPKRPSSVPGVVRKLEQLNRVRGRFRRSQPWLRFPVDDAGKEIPHCIKALVYNHEIISVILREKGTGLIAIDEMQKEVKKLYKRIPFVPEDADQAYKDAWNIRYLVSYAIRRQKDGSRRAQTARDSDVRKLFKLIGRLRSRKSDDGSEEGEESEDNNDDIEVEVQEESEPIVEKPVKAPASKGKNASKGKVQKPQASAATGGNASSGSGRSAVRVEYDSLMTDISELESKLRKLPPLNIGEPGDVVEIQESPVAPRKAPLRRARSKQTENPAPQKAANDNDDTQPVEQVNDVRLEEVSPKVPVTVTPEDQISNHKKAKANVRRGRKPKNEKTESKGKPKAAPKSKGSKKNPKVSDTAEPSAPEAAPEPKGRKRKQIEKAQTSRKMTAQSAPEKTFGCSRCRYAALGCKTCRAPGFKPRGHRSKVDAAGADDDE